MSSVALESPVATGALPVALVVALAAGFVSFASPCVLPLVPGFLGYVTGLSDVSLQERRRSRLVLGTLLFVLGFSVVFMALGVVVSAASFALREHLDLLTRIGGGVVIVLALVFLGVGERLGSQRTVAPRWRAPAGLVGAPLLGAVFALGWAPCTGPTLGAILALNGPLGGDGGIVLRGVLLALAYSLGLGLPFLIIAGAYSRFGRTTWIHRHQRAIHRFGAGLLLLVGVLMLTGTWTEAIAWVQAHLFGASAGAYRTVL
ncbi:MAG: cytochrome c biogenesis CcdA family protein [Actinomycetota bacterium]|nr:cytochrome c biogenesis CcdA family protein [Actinomycetota bacterium]